MYIQYIYNANGIVNSSEVRLSIDHARAAMGNFSAKVINTPSRAAGAVCMGGSRVVPLVFLVNSMGGIRLAGC
jgi:hypothetical protein